MMKRSVFLSIGLLAWPVMALSATPDGIRACEADRTGPGCATLRNQIFVCAQAPAIRGCEALLALREAALADPEDLPDDEIEPDVTPRAEGELAEDPSADEASGVADDGTDDPGGNEDALAQADAAGTGECPVIDSADWRAVVGPVDGAEGPHLIVTGTITLPTPGWTVALEAGIADRSARPVQQVNLVATPPGGDMMVAQVLTGYDLRLQTPALGSAPGTGGEGPYRGVLVMCGSEVVIDITEVPLVE